MKLVFIRHGSTAGNHHKRYIGKTDEPLSEAGISQVQAGREQKRYPDAGLVFVSPMLRCRQTAKLLFPSAQILVMEDLRECDFGVFEGKNYQELQQDKRYQDWIDSDGQRPFPEGEDPQGFKARCCGAFKECIEYLSTVPEVTKEIETAAFVVHGGTIMSIFECYARVKKTFYQWHVDNAGGYLAELNGDLSKPEDMLLDGIKAL